MQTFLPYYDFIQTAKCLDYRRLGKQRVEAMQLLNVFDKLKTDPNKKVAWMNHPARLMWVGYEEALEIYHDTMIQEWISRGYNNTMKFRAKKPYYQVSYPPWLGDIEFHNSHRSNLLRKDPDYYKRYNWELPDNLEYIWPVSHEMINYG